MKTKIIVLVMCGMVLCGAAQAAVVTNFTAAADTEFTNLLNWDNGAPFDNFLYVADGLTAVHSTGTEYELNTNNTTARLVVGAGGTSGTLELTNGSKLKAWNGMQDFTIGLGAGSTGYVTIGDGSRLWIWGGGADIYIGDLDGGYGEINVLAGGTLYSQKATEVINGRLHFAATAGTYQVWRDELVVDNGGTLAFDIDGTAVTKIGGESLLVELGSTSTLELNLTGDYSIGDSWTLISGITSFGGVVGGDGTGVFGNITNSQGLGPVFDIAYYIDPVTAHIGTLTVTLTGLGAANSPTPADKAQLVSTTTDLSWVSPTPDPNDYRVFFGTTEPNSLLADYGLLELAVAHPFTGTTIDPGDLLNDTIYHWVVDTYEPNDPGTPYRVAAGYHWSFTTEPYDVPLTVDAGDSSIAALQQVIDDTLLLNGLVTDDGTSAVTVLWEAFLDDGVTPADANVIIAIPTDAITSVTSINAEGDYILKITATDAVGSASDTLTIQVRESACDAAKLTDDWTQMVSDYHGDCFVNFFDFERFAGVWLMSNELDNPWYYILE